ncbi:alpha/beta hydrolase family protein [Microterricola viridarii]|uniref:Alpha/beta hydrolase family protein n=1 Tax=Microterricola viridarii TaxID=412690 RepID=A0A1H1TVR8_9MICO|nr:alpha/beta fold hydrolase [Microterricola viridarii]SDS63719.1 Alpha/beta hydrolase family protein [Microterricola viridarii]
MDAHGTGGNVRGGRALRRWLIGGGIALGATVLAVGAALAAVVAVFARTVVTPPRGRKDELRILDANLADATIVLAADNDTVVDGRYGLWFSADQGHARVGEVLRRSESTVTRRLLGVDFGQLALASEGRWSGWFYLGPWEFELPYENVTVPTPVGPAPAWWVPAAEPSTRWVVQVHGRAVRRQECLRAIPVFHEAGMHSLIVSYRNDGEAPESRDGRYGLGDTEWQDVAAALRFAREHGARDIVLMGWSMGGAIAMQTALRAEERDLLRGIVLESPAVDWHDILHFQGAGYGLPRAVNSAAIQTISSPWGRAVTGLEQPIDFERLDMAVRSAELTLPILLMHSVDDGFVPIAGSRELAAARPDIVTFEEFARARHTKLWNYDPERWNGAIRSWLAAL